MEHGIFRRTFQEFGEWCSLRGIRPLTLKITGNAEDDAWNICQKLWEENGIEPGYLRTHGGAGRVVWMEAGRVVDCVWMFDMEGWPGLDSIEGMKVRTIAAFDSR
jgi:hypothetical protein